MNTFLRILMTVSFLSMPAIPALAEHGDIQLDPQNPQSYDVPAAEYVHARAAENLNQARRVFDGHELRYREKNAELERAIRHLERLNNEITQTRADINSTQQQILGLQAALQTLRTSLNQIQQEIPAKEQEIKNEEGKATGLQDHYNHMQGEVKALERTAAELTIVAASKRTAANEKLNFLNGHKKTLRDKEVLLQSTKNLEANLLTKVTAIEEQIRTLTIRLADLVKQLPGLTETRDRAEHEALEREEEANRLAELARIAKENNDPNAPELERQAEGARVAANGAKAQAEAAEAALARLTNEVNQLESTLNAVQTELAGKQSELNNVRAELESIKQRISELTTLVADSNREFQTADNIAKLAEGAVIVAEAAVAQARGKANSALAALNAANARVAELKAALQQLKVRKADLETQIANHEAQIANKATALANLQTQLQNQIATANRQTANIRQLENELRRVIDERNAAADMVRRLGEDEELARNVLEAVRNMLARGISVAQNDGRMDGAPDGNTDGGNLGKTEGAIAGNDKGRREGIEQGTAAGIAAARQAGTNAGRLAGDEAGKAEGAALGRQQAEEAGPRDGRLAGLKESFDIGFKEGNKEGLPKGEEAAHTSGEYEAARKAAYDLAKERARKEANRVGEPKGVKKADDEFFNAQLKDVVLPNHDAVQPQSTIFAHGDPDWTKQPNFKPRRSYLVIRDDLLNRAYFDSYSQNYGAAAAAAFDREHKLAFDAAYRFGFNEEFNTYSRQDYPNERQAAFDKAKETARLAAFEPARKAKYTEIYWPLHEAARKRALPEGSEEGRLEKGRGREAGYNLAFAKGKKDEIAVGTRKGDETGYSENYETLHQEAIQRAYNERVKFFNENAVLDFDGFSVIDANEDTVFAPGETLLVSVAVKNFGKAPQKTPVTVELSRASGGLDLGAGRDTLVALPGQSRAVVTRVAPLKLLSKSTDGSREKFTATLMQDGQAIGRAELLVSVSFPYSVTAINVPNVVTAETENKVELTIRNRSSKLSAQPLAVKLVSTDGLTTIQTAEQAPGKIKAGESAKTEFVFTFPKENAFKVLNFDVEIREGNWMLGKRSFAVNSSKRWTYNPASSGLVVLSSTDTGDRIDNASKLASLVFDCWDTQVEGQLSSEVALKYRDKGILVPSVDSELTIDTMRSLGIFLAQGGEIFAGMNPNISDRTEVGTLFRNAANKMPSFMIGSMTVTQDNFFKQSANNNVLAFGNGTAVKGDGASLAKELVLFKLLTKSLEDKVAAFLATAVVPRSELTEAAKLALLYELGKEMKDDSDIAGMNFRDRTSTLRLTKFINLTLSKSGNDRTWLASLHQDLDRLRRNLRGPDDFLRRRRIDKVLQPLRSAYFGNLTLIP